MSEKKEGIFVSGLRNDISKIHEEVKEYENRIKELENNDPIRNLKYVLCPSNKRQIKKSIDKIYNEIENIQSALEAQELLDVALYLDDNPEDTKKYEKLKQENYKKYILSTLSKFPRVKYLIQTNEYLNGFFNKFIDRYKGYRRTGFSYRFDFKYLDMFIDIGCKLFTCLLGKDIKGFLLRLLCGLFLIFASLISSTIYDVYEPELKELVEYHLDE